MGKATAVSANPDDRDESCRQEADAGAKAQHRAAGDRPSQREGKPVERGRHSEHEPQFRRQLVRAFPQSDRAHEQQHRRPEVGAAVEFASRSRRGGAASGRRTTPRRRVPRRATEAGATAPCRCRSPPDRRAAGCRRRVRRQDTGRARRRVPSSRGPRRTWSHPVSSTDRGRPSPAVSRPRRARRGRAASVRRSAPSGRRRLASSASGVGGHVLGHDRVGRRRARRGAGMKKAAEAAYPVESARQRPPAPTARRVTAMWFSQARQQAAPPRSSTRSADGTCRSGRRCPSLSACRCRTGGRPSTLRRAAACQRWTTVTNVLPQLQVTWISLYFG